METSKNGDGIITALWELEGEIMDEIFEQQDMVTA